MKQYWNILLSLTLVSSLVSCSVSHQIKRSASQSLLTQPALKQAHVGVSIYDPVTKNTGMAIKQINILCPLAIQKFLPVMPL